MPWRETSVMNARLRFVARLLEGESMSDVCRSFGISRKTGYKIFNRYKDEGLEALTDRCRRPVRYANQLPEPVEAMIVRFKKEKPRWGGTQDSRAACCGRLCIHRKKINISTALAGQRLGLKEVDDGIWLVSFLSYDLGYIDLEQRTLQTIDNPFGTRLLPMS